MGSTKDLILLGNPDEGKGRGQERQTDGQQPVAPQQQPAPQLAEQGAAPGETKADTEERLAAEAKNIHAEAKNIHADAQPVMSYQKLYGLLNPQPTQEELEKRRKKEKRDKLFASIGDGLNALSSIVNLYYTTKGAPSMYKPKESLSDKERDRWERLHKEFDAKGKEYAAGMERARRLDDEAANDRKKWKLYFAKEKAARDAQAAALKRQTAKDAADQKHKDDMVQLGKERNEETAKYHRNMEKIAAQNAQSNRIRASKSGRGGSGGGKYIVYPPESSGRKPFAVPNKSMYDYWNTFYYGADNKNTSETYVPIKRKDGPEEKAVTGRTTTVKGKNSTQRAAEAARKAAEVKRAAEAARKAAEVKRAAEAQKKAAAPQPKPTAQKKEQKSNWAGGLKL